MVIKSISVYLTDRQAGILEDLLTEDINRLKDLSWSDDKKEARNYVISLSGIRDAVRQGMNPF